MKRVGAPEESMERLENLKEKNRANKKHHCSICNKTFNIKGHLDREVKSRRRADNTPKKKR